MLLVLIFPKFDLEVLAWVAAVPLFWAIAGQSIRRSFWLGLLCGVVHYLGTIYWIAYTLTRYGKLPMAAGIAMLLLLVVYMAAYWGIFAAVIRWLEIRRGLIFPVTAPLVWTALEYARTYFLSGFPWALLGYSQYKTLPSVQIADITGVYGVSFVIMLVNACLAYALVGWVEERDPTINARWTALGGALVLLLSLGYGWWQISSYPAHSGKPLRVGVAQGNIEQDIKWDPAFQQETVNIYRGLTQELVRQRVQMAVWPETAAPFYFQSDKIFQPQICNLARSRQVPLLFGSPAYQTASEDVTFYNAAFFVSPDGQPTGIYNKIHLVPFGEYIPLRWLLGFAGEMLGGIIGQIGDFGAGETYTIFHMPQGNFGVVICFEILFPDLVRRFPNSGADFLVNITNDAWFGDTAAPYQHFSTLTLRAVENRRYIVRAANTGISGFVDPLGSPASQTQIFTRGCLVQDIYLNQGKTFYSRYGDIFSMMCSLAVIGMILWAVRKNKLE